MFVDVPILFVGKKTQNFLKKCSHTKKQSQRSVDNANKGKTLAPFNTGSNAEFFPLRIYILYVKHEFILFVLDFE